MESFVYSITVNQINFKNYTDQYCSGRTTVAANERGERSAAYRSARQMVSHARQGDPSPDRPRLQPVPLQPQSAVLLLSVQTGAYQSPDGRTQACVRRAGHTEASRRPRDATTENTAHQDQNIHRSGRDDDNQDDHVQVQVRPVGSVIREQPSVRADFVVPSGHLVRVRMYFIISRYLH